MSEERLYDLAAVAKALGVSKQAVTNRAGKGRKGNKNHPSEDPWQVHSTEIRQGQTTRLFAYSDLPQNVKKAINAREEARRAVAAVARVNEMAREEDARYAREMAEAGKSLGEMEQEKADAKRAKRIRRIEEGRRKFGQLPKDDPKRKRAKALEWVLHSVGEYRRTHRLGGKQARIEYCAKIASGEIVLPEWVEPHMPKRENQRHLVEPTLRRWVYTYKEDGIWGLTPGWGKSLGNSRINNNPGLFRLVLGALIKYPQITPRTVKEFLTAEHPELNICSQKAIERFFKHWKDENSQIWTYISHPDKWKNIYMAGVGSVFEQIARPNQLWELDSTPGDWLLTDGRHSVVGCIDMHTRRVKLFVSKSSTAAAVKQVLRRSMLDWGVPEAVRTDNGKDYVSDEVDSLLCDLEIIHEICIPFASEDKGTIERFFRTMSHGVLNLLEGFIGHNVAERKEIESRKSFADRIMKKDAVVEVQISSSELQQKLDEWVEHYYEQSPHGGLNNQSPWDVWRAWNKPLRKITDEHALDELMTEIGGIRVIGKKGIRYDNRHFFDQDGLIFHHVGRQVMLRLDEQDMGHLAVYLDGAFLCWVEDPDTTGISRRECAKAIKHSQKKFMGEQAAELKQYTKEVKKNPAQAIVDYRKSQSENVVDLPKRTEEYSTPALEAAGEAARTRLGEGGLADTATGEIIAQPTTAEVVDYDAFRTDFEKNNKQVLAEEDGRRIHAHWLRVEADIESHEPVSLELRRGLEIYRQSGQYRSRQELFDAFGLTADDFV